MLYITYDGVGEPLGTSQVLGYLRHLCGEFEITLVSFEKSDAEMPRIRRELEELGIRWHPLRYHRHPPVASTLLDVLAGVRAAWSASRGMRPDIVHVRSYVPALMALLAAGFTQGRLLFDIRGFWADERVEGGIWRAGGALFRFAKWCEARFFRRADAVVTLTQASVPEIRARVGSPAIPISVIPTCVDLSRFTPRPASAAGPRAVWSGSLGTWYRFDLVPAVVEALGLPLIVLTRQVQEARGLLGGLPAEVKTVSPASVAEELHCGDIGLCLIKQSYSKIASAPTRFAEYLAAGMPVLVTAGVGDLEAIVERHRVGWVLRTADSHAIAEAAAEMRALLRDSDLATRCRNLALERFDVRAGAALYAGIYTDLLQ